MRHLIHAAPSIFILLFSAASHGARIPRLGLGRTLAACAKYLSPAPLPPPSVDIDASTAAWFSPAHQPNLKHDYLAETLFIVPSNDGEALRTLAILRGVGAPFVHESRQSWGASIDREIIPIEFFDRVKRVVVMEMPGRLGEEAIIEAGKELVIVDHHGSKDFPERYRPESAIAQIAELIGYTMSECDRAIAVNDCGYISGLRRLGLDDVSIRAIREFDLRAQGRSLPEIHRAVADAHDLIPFLATYGNVTYFDRETVDSSILGQELAMRSPDGISRLCRWHRGISYSGDSRTVDALSQISLESYGLDPADYDMYHGGDRSGDSMFFNLSPKDSTKRPLPDALLDHADDLIVQSASPVLGPPLEPKTELAYQTFGRPGQPAIVLMHDAWSTSATFTRVAKLLAQDFFVVTYDARGFGNSVSRGTVYSARQLSVDLENLINHLHLTKVNLVAHGLTGKTALWFAAHHPRRVARLVLEDAPIGPTERATSRGNDLYARKLEAIRHSNSANKQELINSVIFGAQARREDAEASLAKIDRRRVLMLNSISSPGSTTRKGQSPPTTVTIAAPGPIHGAAPGRFVTAVTDFLWSTWVR